MQSSPPAPALPSLLAFQSSWLIMSSSLSPQDSTCHSIGQQGLCEVTWEPSHWALRPPWGLLKRRGKKAQKGPWMGAGLPGTKQPGAECREPLYRARAWQGAQGENEETRRGEDRWEGLSIVSCHPFLCPSKEGERFLQSEEKSEYERQLRWDFKGLRTFWTSDNHSVQNFPFELFWRPFETPWEKTWHLQLHFVTKSLN